MESAPNFKESEPDISCHYMQFDQCACMFRLSHIYQWRQGMGDIAVIAAVSLRTEIPDITGFFSL